MAHLIIENASSREARPSRARTEQSPIRLPNVKMSGRIPCRRVIIISALDFEGKYVPAEAFGLLAKKTGHAAAHNDQIIAQSALFRVTNVGGVV